jgi:toxin ParE1/3/4
MMSWNQESMTNEYRYRLTPDARSDLLEIRRFSLAQWGSRQSEKYLGELRQVLRLLSESPGMGKQRPDLGGRVFGFSHASHVIYYQLHLEQVVVFAVLHKSMVPLSHLENRNTS